MNDTQVLAMMAATLYAPAMAASLKKNGPVDVEAQALAIQGCVDIALDILNAAKKKAEKVGWTDEYRGR